MRRVKGLVHDLKKSPVVVIIGFDPSTACGTGLLTKFGTDRLSKDARVGRKQDDALWPSHYLGIPRSNPAAREHLGTAALVRGPVSQ